MRTGLWQIALVVGCLVANRQFVDAQESPLTSPIARNQTCPPFPIDDAKSAAPEISIAQLTFSGDLRLPVSGQQAIAESIREATHGNDLEGVMDDALERARRGWQDRGYFKVEVRGEAKVLTASPVSQRVALDVRVDEGPQYRLTGISFKNNKAIKSRERLRQFFPLNNGDIFSREKVAVGLENLRKAYGQIGYINFTSVPDTSFDEENKSISLIVDVDEGKQFHVGAVDVLGLEDPARERFIESLPIKTGQVYSSKVWEQTLRMQGSLLPCDCPNRQQKRLDEKSGIVTLALDFRPCTPN